MQFGPESGSTNFHKLYFNKTQAANISGLTPARAWLTRGGWGARGLRGAGAAASMQEMPGAVKEARGPGGLLQEMSGDHPLGRPGVMEEARGRWEPDWSSRCSSPAQQSSSQAEQ